VDSVNQKILILSGVRGDTRRYHTLHLYQQLRLAGVDRMLSHTTDPRLPTLVSQAEVMVLHRVTYDSYIATLIQSVHARGGLVLLDTDDLIYDPQAFQWIDSPDFQDPVRAKLYLDDMHRYRQTLDRCDGVLASTDFLAGHVRALGKPCWVHRNAANLELVQQSEQARRQRRPADGKIVIGYASGTPTHCRDFKLVADVLQNMLETDPNIEIRIIGYLDLDRSWKRFRDRVKRFDPVPWRFLPLWLAQLDINLAPLALDNPFSQSKSEIKYMEAARVGIPTLASRTDAFAAAIRSGENGLLAASPEEWQAQLNRLVDPNLRQSLGQAANLDTRLKYFPQVRARQAVELLNEVSASLERSFQWQANFNETADLEELGWNPELERHPTLAEMGLYTLRHRGASTLTQQVWIYFRRWLARFIPYGEAKK